MAEIMVEEPFPVFSVANRFLIFDVDTASYIRREHHMTGVFIGNIPQAAQQNTFSGIPMELMPEEARLLVGKGHAFVVDDVQSHEQQMANMSDVDRICFLRSLNQRGFEAAREVQKSSDKKKAVWRAKSKKTTTLSKKEETIADLASLLFKLGDPFRRPASLLEKAAALEPLLITPTSSYPPLKIIPPKSTGSLPAAPTSYPLFAHLHSKGYFISPGLRFGCQYMAYPGDPLRFHSHFLAVGKTWDEPIDLLDIVGGGRLGTGVKKGYLLGGVEDKDGKSEPSSDKGSVRTFCFEWAAI